MAKYTSEVVEILEDAFRDGASITEACDLAKIDRKTYYNWIEAQEGFSTKMQEAQDWVDEVARAVVAQKITKRKDVETAKWWLERRVKDKYSTRTENTGKDGKDLPAPTFQVMTNEAKILLESLYERPDSAHD